MRLELQRLLAHGPGTLPGAVVVDVGAVARLIAEQCITIDVWAQIATAANRGGRDLVWLVGPTSVQHEATSRHALNAIVPALCQLAAPVIVSTQPTPGLLRRVRAGRRVALVTAGVEDHPYELHVLGGAVESVLDIATGVLWTADKTALEYVRPDAMPLLSALSGDVPGLEPIVRAATKPSNYERMRQALGKGLGIRASELPATIKNALLSRPDAIRERLALLGGRRPVDPAAPAAVERWLEPPSAIAWEAGDPHGAYVVAAVHAPMDTDWTFRQIVIKPWGKPTVEARGHDACVDLLRHLPPTALAHWTMPRALDVMGAMTDAGLPLPERVFDPGIALFVSDPIEEPRDPADVDGALHVLPRVAREWVADFRRERDITVDVAPIAEELERLEKLAERTLTAVGQSDFYHTEITPLLPLLARIEREGAWVGPPNPYGDWSLMQGFVDADLQDALLQVARLPANVDPLRADSQTLVDALRESCGTIPKPYYPGGYVAPKDALERYYALSRLSSTSLPFAAVPRALKRARALGSESGIRYWISALATSDRLRGRFVPQRTGRWGLSRYALQNIPKHSSAGANDDDDFPLELRSGLCAPPGHVLLGADWSAFEPRLLAELSRDPALVAACQTADPYSHLGAAIGGGFSREQLKTGTLALGYGQTARGFIAKQYDLPCARAVLLHTALSQMMAGALAYAGATVAQYRRTGSIQTRGGWRRVGLDRDEAAINSLVQGYGADLQRHVIRELARALPHGARVVHVVHDEVVVTCLDSPKVILDVERKLTQTMERAGVASGLMSGAVPLMVKLSKGDTWRDIA